MSIKGYSTQKKENSLISGYTDKQTQDSSQFSTFQETYSDKVLLDTVNSSLFRLHVGVKTAEANSTDRILKSTAHGAQKGDVVRFDLASANPYFESKVLSIPDADTIIISAKLPTSIITGDEFYLLRHVSQRVDETGASIVTITPSPILFSLDNVDTEVSEDTITPANSNPLPIKALDGNGVEVDFATEAKQDTIITNIQTVDTSVQSVNTSVQAVDVSVQAVDTSVQAVETAVNNAITEIQTVQTKIDKLKGNSGSFVQTTLTGTTDSTATVPANAIGFYIQAPSTNSDNIRFCVGSTASTTNGVLMEAGRSEGPFNLAADVSVCATASTVSNEFIIQWILSV
jgi:hypothetical protein